MVPQVADLKAARALSAIARALDRDKLIGILRRGWGLKVKVKPGPVLTGGHASPLSGTARADVPSSMRCSRCCPRTPPAPTAC